MTDNRTYKTGDRVVLLRKGEWRGRTGTILRKSWMLMSMNLEYYDVQFDDASYVSTYNTDELRPLTPLDELL